MPTVRPMARRRWRAGGSARIEAIIAGRPPLRRRASPGEAPPWGPCGRAAAGAAVTPGAAGAAMTGAGNVRLLAAGGADAGAAHRRGRRTAPARPVPTAPERPVPTAPARPIPPTAAGADMRAAPRAWPRRGGIGLGGRSGHRRRRRVAGGDRRHDVERHPRWCRQRLQQRSQIEDLAGAGLDLGGLRARRRLGEELGLLECRNQPSRAGALAPDEQFLLRLLVPVGALQLELQQPRVVGHQLGDVVEQLHAAGELVLAGEHQVVVARLLVEFAPQHVGRFGGDLRLIGLPLQRDREVALLPDRERDGDGGDCRQHGQRKPELPAQPRRRRRSSVVGEQVQSRRNRRGA